MKEIDFLPEWYKSSKRRQVSYRTQYIAISGVFAVMIVWSLTAARSISKIQAQVDRLADEQAQAQQVSAEFAGLEDDIEALRKKAESIEKIDSRINVANILAELSYLIDERVVLRKAELVAEKFENEQEAKDSKGTNTVVRAVSAVSKNKKELPLGDVRFKVVIAGVAADASDVATLMCKLEDSPYFCQVDLAFSRGDAKVNASNTPAYSEQTSIDEENVKSKNAVPETKVKSEIQVNEFEINCYLANYRQL